MAKRTSPTSPPTPRTSSISANASTAQFDLPAGRFMLTALFERVPSVHVTIEPAVANPDDHLLMTVRVDDRKQYVVETCLRSAPAVAAVEYLGEGPSRWIYRITLDGQPRRVMRQLMTDNTMILSAQGQASRWEINLLAPDRNGIAQASDVFCKFNCEAECVRILTFDDKRSTQEKLTEKQREALVTAFESGYYNVPRDITTAELAEELGISHQALSERFRRAYQRLIETNLTTGPSESGINR
jgi:predicted DNA binding protein